MSTTTPSRQTVKPRKPYPTFPLTPTPRGWVKKINGKLYWFGPAHDPDGALARYHDRAKELHASKTARVPTDRISVQDLAQRYLDARQKDVEAGELTIAWYAKTFAALNRFVASAGASTPASSLGPDHFAAYRRACVGHGLDNAIRAVRTWIKTAVDMEWVEPVRMGTGFKPRSASLIRAAQVERMFSPSECRKMIDATSDKSQMRAMLLLAMNAGMGQTDLADLTVDAVNLDAGTVNFPRPKTGVKRRFVLWPETIEALKWHVGGKTSDALVFRTSRGNAWVRQQPSKKGLVSTIDQVSFNFDKLLPAADVPKDGRNFYTLRRTFRTLADEQGDQRAIALVMGHKVADMGNVYVQRISDDRLRAVVMHVRDVIVVRTASPATVSPTS